MARPKPLPDHYATLNLPQKTEFTPESLFLAYQYAKLDLGISGLSPDIIAARMGCVSPPPAFLSVLVVWEIEEEEEEGGSSEEIELIEWQVEGAYWVLKDKCRREEYEGLWVAWGGVFE